MKQQPPASEGAVDAKEPVAVDPASESAILSSEASQAARKMIQVEMDEDAYFETFKKHKKMV